MDGRLLCVNIVFLSYKRTSLTNTFDDNWDTDNFNIELERPQKQLGPMASIEIILPCHTYHIMSLLSGGLQLFQNYLLFSFERNLQMYPSFDTAGRFSRNDV